MLFSMQLHSLATFMERKQKRKENLPPHPHIKKINKRKKGSNKTRVREIEIFTVKIKNST